MTALVIEDLLSTKSSDNQEAEDFGISAAATTARSSSAAGQAMSQLKWRFRNGGIDMRHFRSETVPPLIPVGERRRPDENSQVHCMQDEHVHQLHHAVLHED